MPKKLQYTSDPEVLKELFGDEAEVPMPEAHHTMDPEVLDELFGPQPTALDRLKAEGVPLQAPRTGLDDVVGRLNIFNPATERPKNLRDFARQVGFASAEVDTTGMAPEEIEGMAQKRLGEVKIMRAAEGAGRAVGGRITSFAEKYGDARNWPELGERTVRSVLAGAAQTVPSLVISAAGLGSWDQAVEKGMEWGDWLEEKVAVENPEFYDQLMLGFGSMAAFMGIGKGIQGVARVSANGGRYMQLFSRLMGVSGSAVAEAAIESAETIKTLMREKGYTLDMAVEEAGKTFWLNLPVIMASNWDYFNPAISRLSRMVREAPEEGVQEAWQAVVQNLVTGRPWDEGLAENAIIGAIVGGTTAVAMPSPNVAPPAGPNTYSFQDDPLGYRQEIVGGTVPGSDQWQPALEKFMTKLEEQGFDKIRNNGMDMPIAEGREVMKALESLKGIEGKGPFQTEGEGQPAGDPEVPGFEQVDGDELIKPTDVLRQEGAVSEDEFITPTRVPVLTERDAEILDNFSNEEVIEITNGALQRDAAAELAPDNSVEVVYAGDHYSKVEGLRTLDPTMMGSSEAGREFTRGYDYKTPYIQVYALGEKPEPRLARKSRYRIITTDLYEWDTDPLGLIPKHLVNPKSGARYQGESLIEALDELYTELKDSGYKGVSFNSGNQFRLFTDEQVHKLERRQIAYSPIVSDEILEEVRDSDPELHARLSRMRELQDTGQFEALYEEVVRATEQIVDDPAIDIKSIKPADGRYFGDSEFSLVLTVDSADDAVLEAKVGDLVNHFWQESAIISKELAAPAVSAFNVTSKFVSGARVWDQQQGAGAVPSQQNVRYEGWTVWMTPGEFLSLNPERHDELHAPVADDIRAGRAVATPFLSVDVNEETGEVRVHSHEGRGRAAVLAEVDPDTPIPVNVFPRKGLRARDVQPEWTTAPILPDSRREGGAAVVPWQSMLGNNTYTNRPLPGTSAATAVIGFKSDLTQADAKTIDGILTSIGLDGSTFDINNNALVIHYIPEWANEDAAAFDAKITALNSRLREVFGDDNVEGEELWYRHTIVEGRDEGRQNSKRRASANVAGEASGDPREGLRRGYYRDDRASSEVGEAEGDQEGLTRQSAPLASPAPTEGGPGSSVVNDPQEVVQLALDLKPVTFPASQGPAVARAHLKHDKARLDAAVNHRKVLAEIERIKSMPGVTTKYSAYVENVADPHGFSLVDMVIDSMDPQAFFVAAQVLRNPKFESARVAYVKRLPGGELQVLGEEVMTNYSKSSVAYKYHDRIPEIEATMKRLGADGLIHLHNHPSGVALPSPADAGFWIGMIDAKLPLLGAAVIDHGSYTWLDENTLANFHRKGTTRGLTVQEFDKDVKDFFWHFLPRVAGQPDPLVNDPPNSSYYTGSYDPQGLLNLAQGMYDEDTATILYWSDKRVRVVETMNIDTLLAHYDKEEMRLRPTAHGGEMIIVLPEDALIKRGSPYHTMQELERVLYRRGIAGDIILARNDGTYKSVAMSTTTGQDDSYIQGVPSSQYGTEFLSDKRAKFKVVKKGQRVMFAEELAAKTRLIMGYPGKLDTSKKSNRKRAVDRLVKGALHDLTVEVEKTGVDAEAVRQWYREDVTRYLAMLEHELPGISQDPVRASFLNFLLAVTSPGIRLKGNFEYAVNVMKHYEEHGVFPIWEGTNMGGKTVHALWSVGVDGVPKQVGGVTSGKLTQKMERLQGVIEKLGGIGPFVEWMTTEHSQSEFLEVLEKFDDTWVLKTGEHLGIMGLGPKVGRYFLNLQGWHEAAVYDRWYSFWAYRHLGTPTEIANDPKTKKSAWEQTAGPRSKTDWSIFDEAIERTAEEYSRLTGEQWGVDEIQAVLWFAEKGIYEAYGVERPAINVYTDAAQLRAEGRGYEKEAAAARAAVPYEGRGKPAGEGGPVLQDGLDGVPEESLIDFRDQTVAREEELTAQTATSGDPSFITKRGQTVASKYGPATGAQLERAELTRQEIDRRKKPTMRRYFRNWFHHLVDNLTFVYSEHARALKRAGRSMAKLMGTKPGEVPYILLRLGRASHAVADNMIKWGVPDTNDRSVRLTRGLDEILAEVGDDLDVFQMYIAALHLPELNRFHKKQAKRRGQGHYQHVDRAVLERAAKLIQEVEAVHGMKWRKLAREVSDFMDTVSKWVVEMGGEDPQLWNLITYAYKHYVPLWNMMKIGPDGKPVGAPGEKAATFVGRKGAVPENFLEVPIFEAIYQNTTFLVDAVMHNAAKLALYDAIADLPELGEQVAPRGVDGGQIRAFHDAVSANQTILDAVAGADQLDQDLIEALSSLLLVNQGLQQNLLAARRNGKTVYMRVASTDVWDTFAGMATDQLPPVLRVAGIASRIFRLGVTLTWEFGSRNATRDAWASFVLGKKSNILLPYLRAWRGVFKEAIGVKDDGYNAWVASFGSQGTMAEADAKMVGSLTRDLLKNGLRRGPRKYTFMMTRDIFRTMSLFAGLSDSPSRMAQFEALLKDNLKKVEAGEMTMRDAYLHAGFNSRWPSTDFLTYGKSGKWLNTLMVFFNPALQGTMITARRLLPQKIAGEGDTGQTWLKGFLSITVPSLFLWANYHDEEWYEDLPLWIRNHYWVIPMPPWDSDPRNLMIIPKPFELGLIFGSLPERILDAHHLNDPKAVKNWARDFLLSLNPLSVPIPPVAAYLEYKTNYNFFTERAQVNPWLGKQRAAFQFHEGTSEFSKLLGQLAPGDIISPIKVDTFVKSTFGTLGKHGLTVMSEAITLADPTRKKVRPSAHMLFGLIPIERWPAVGAWIRPVDQPRTEFTDRFYEYLHESRRAYNTALSIAENGAPPADIKRFIYDDLFWLDANVAWEEVAEYMGEMTKVINFLEKTQEIPPGIETKLSLADWKREQLDEWYARQAQAARTAVKEFEKARSEITPAEMKDRVDAVWEGIQKELQTNSARKKLLK